MIVSAAFSYSSRATCISTIKSSKILLKSLLYFYTYGGIWSLHDFGRFLQQLGCRLWWSVLPEIQLDWLIVTKLYMNNNQCSLPVQQSSPLRHVGDLAHPVAVAADQHGLLQHLGGLEIDNNKIHSKRLKLVKLRIDMSYWFWCIHLFKMRLTKAKTLTLSIIDDNVTMAMILWRHYICDV